MSLFLRRIHKTVVYHENDVFSRYFKSFCIFNDYIYTMACGIQCSHTYNHYFIMRRSIHQLLVPMSPSYINSNSRHPVYHNSTSALCTVSYTLHISLKLYTYPHIYDEISIEMMLDIYCW